ncbi:MAG TPA: prolyl oligopeptidase family serine peptidase [Thermoanaerobaculia bacterium]|nr:prolyl oligopeptidase family serine peptidase [Thermoanaerobaculia bacterium]
MRTTLVRYGAIATVVFASSLALAQPPRPAFTLDQIMAYPFPENLTVAPSGGRIAWTFDERGVRNIYVADGLDFTARRVTSYDADDGQELTGLTFSDDGNTIVYVRGGDHGSNWPAEGNLMPDPTSSPVQPKMEIWAANAASGGAPRLIAEGDDPAIAPKTQRVAFVRNHRIWIAPLDGSTPAKEVFVRGSSESPKWSPDGRTLAFVSSRGDHSFIALFTAMDQPVRYIAPSTSRDSMPAWSPDGMRIVLVRQPGRGGVPTIEPKPEPWALWIADAAAGTAREVWKSGTRREDQYPRIPGALRPSWAAGDRIVFMGYQDGWPHLYSVAAAGGAATLLTPGAFMVEQSSLSPDRRTIVYSANTGADRLDIDRRHIFKVSVDAPNASAITAGNGIEWSPAITPDGHSVVFLESDAQRSPLPAVQPLDGGATRRIAADRVPADFPASQLVTPQQVIFTSSDGLEVHGQLFKTPGGPARRPALIYVHGGPPRQMLLGWHYMGYYAHDYSVNQYLASRGFIVLSVNYRLGIGYGHHFQDPGKTGPRGAAEYLDVLAGGKYLQGRDDVDPKRIGIWGGSYGGYLTALALGRNSDIFAAGVDIHGVHNWARQGRRNEPNLIAAFAGDGISEDDLKQAAKVAYDSSPISAVGTWKSPVLLIQGDDDRNVDFDQTVDLRQRLEAKGVNVEELVIPDDIHDFLMYRSWRAAAGAVTGYFEKTFLH